MNAAGFGRRGVFLDVRGDDEAVIFSSPSEKDNRDVPHPTCGVCVSS